MIPWACYDRNLLLVPELAFPGLGTGLPQPVKQASSTHLDVQMPLGRKVLEHLVGLVHRKRGLHSRLGRRELTAPLQGLQELALPRTGEEGLVRTVSKARNTPDKQPEGGEDHPAEHEDQPPEPRGG